MKRSMRVIGATITALCVLASVTNTGFASSAFVDVKSSSVYAPYIADLATRGIAKGNGDGTFRPDDTLTRAQFVTMAVQAFGYPKSERAVRFADSSEHWGGPYIQSAYENGLVAGKTETAFAPDAPVSVQEADVIVWRELLRHGVQAPKTQADVQADSWAVDSVSAIVQNHLYADDPNGPYQTVGNQAMTRGQAAALISQTLQKFKAVTEPLVIVNPTANPANLIANPDGSWSMGNITMPKSITSHQMEDGLRGNLNLMAAVTFTTDGGKITINLPETGDKNIRWIVGDASSQWEGSESKSLTYDGVKSLGLGLNDWRTAHMLALAYIRYQNGRWVVAYRL